MFFIQKILYPFVLFLFITNLGVGTANSQSEQEKESNIKILSQFYHPENENYYFVRPEGAFTPLAAQVVDLLYTAPHHGLEPTHYGSDRLKRILTETQPTSPRAWREAEFLWFLSVWSYASDLAGKPLPSTSMNIILNAKNPIQVIEKLEPHDPLYQKLSRELEAKQANPPPHTQSRILFDFGNRPFKVGMDHADIPLLRQRLHSFGANPSDQTRAYDAVTVQAVRRFQQKHGLVDDGVIGGLTLTLLNRTDAEEIEQIIANLHRLREKRFAQRPARRIDVSIAQFKLFAYDNHQAVLNMPVIVGRPERETLDFQADITGLRLNPTWTVPDTIKHEDMLAKLRTNPEKLNALGIQIYAANGMRIDPKYIDWNTVGRKEMARLRLFRPAGDDNPLGQYRVIMPNPYAIYLHDTNEPAKFKRQYRALSSGCVRVEDPEKLSAFLIQGTKEWTPNRVQETRRRGKTYDIRLDTTIPVYLDYTTAWLDEFGQIVLGVDVYKKDRHTIQAMKKEATQRLGQINKSAADFVQSRASASQVPDSEVDFITHGATNH